jgi:FKBP-type peptidyl-prolyl cis-trans isomerase (trigger factor)
MTPEEQINKAIAETDATIAEAANRLDEIHISESMKEYLDSERATQDMLLERLEKTQERMITAERIINQIYIARNITLSEESMLSALVEIDKTYRTKNDGN